MTFWEHFLRLLPRRPVPAFVALYWHLTRRKVRARNRLRAASADFAFVYTSWIAAKEPAHQLVDRCAEALQEWEWQPRFSILLHSAGGRSTEQLVRSMRSIEGQIYPHWSIAGESEEPLERRIAAAEGDFIVPLRIGDELSSSGLFRIAEAAQASRGASILYGDEDRLDRYGRRMRPWFKPQWNREMFLAMDYLTSSGAIEITLARSACTHRVEHVPALFLAATLAAEGPIIRVPHILAHVPAEPHVEEDRTSAVAQLLEPLGASCGPGPFGTLKIRWPLPEKLPLVTIIVPTRDSLELLRPCVEGVLARTTYFNFELLIVDNGSVEKRTAAYLAELCEHPKVRVVTYAQPFNYSAITNFAVRQASGSFLCLLNNDTEVIEADWLTELMRYAVRPEIGAAGAKLLYKDGSIQHAGIVIGIGDAAGHGHRFLPASEPGYFGMPHVPHYVSAVTAACLVVQKSKFDAVGGFDEEIAVAFNDVDFCLRLQASGWRNAYVPYAVLRHHESKSRGKDQSPKNVERFRRELETLQRRWGTKTYADPVHNPNLDRNSETFVIGE